MSRTRASWWWWGGDYWFINPHNESVLTVNEPWNLVHSPRGRLTAGHPVGWNFEALALFERELDVEVGVGSEMHEQVIGCDDKVPVCDDQFKAEENEGSPRNGDAAADPAVIMSVASPSEVRDETVLRVSASESVVGGDGDHERDSISRFGLLGSAVLVEVDVRSGKRGLTSGFSAPQRVRREMVNPS